MPESLASQQRIVPGAPPPAPLSKTQKKKRKAKVKTGPENSPIDTNDIDHPESPIITTPDAPAIPLVENAPDAGDSQKDVLAPGQETPDLPDELKHSPVVELVSKRLKATTKKITRITVYAATDPEKLNDDQKRILKSLPTLEAVQKELIEVKKAVEVHEAELAHELIAKKLETEKAQRARISDAVAAAESTLVTRMMDVLDLLRLRSLHASGELVADQGEESTIHAIADALLGTDVEKKEAIIKDFLQGSDFDGIPYTRLSEIIAAGLVAPPRTPTPPPVEEIEEVQVEVEPEPTAEVTVTGIPETVYPKTGFSFVQESEIDDTQPVDDGEWIDAGASTAEQVLEEELANDHVEREVTPEPPIQERVAPVVEEPTTGASIDWATDETELPPITSIHESFGMTGPIPSAEVRTEPVPEATNGRPPRPHYRRPHHDEEGFTHSRGGRGRGGGRGFRGDRGGHRGFRGGERGGRGGFRGGEGGFRSGEGGYRSGEGGYRSGEGGHRGEEGGYRGGEGGFRGREGWLQRWRRWIQRQRGWIQKRRGRIQKRRGWLSRRREWWRSWRRRW
ncbi:hypothetical protein F5887DRAFT_647004 [Amanita rubescens]|nr:hypothetical protein F5887DRAFT_647004 [Amanita rubescens]